jgi:hypothetical protein
MADAEKRDFEPQDLIKAKSTFDPQAIGDRAVPAGQGEEQLPPAQEAEQVRREQSKSEFRNNPNYDRDGYLVHIGRGDQTTGRG